MSIVFTVQSEERVLCTSKPLIWEAVQWGWSGACRGRERGQERRIRVINNFCSVINQRHGVPLLSRYSLIFTSSTCSITALFFHPECALSFGIRVLPTTLLELHHIFYRYMGFYQTQNLHSNYQHMAFNPV